MELTVGTKFIIPALSQQDRECFNAYLEKYGWQVTVPNARELAAWIMMWKADAAVYGQPVQPG